jgi:hypothetical protein
MVLKPYIYTVSIAMKQQTYLYVALEAHDNILAYGLVQLTFDSPSKYISY